MKESTRDESGELMTVAIPGRKILILSSVQDFRLKRRGSIQAVAEEFHRQGADVSFVSIRFSSLSKFRDDPRCALRRQANRIEVHEGVKCFLWRTLFHPFRTRFEFINILMVPLFFVYAWIPNSTLDTMIRAADTIIIESGLAIVLLRRIRRLNAHAKLIYRASDRLSTIAQHSALGTMLRKHHAEFDTFCLLGAKMAVDFAWAFPSIFVVPPALDTRMVESEPDNPYDSKLNAITLGAMLFDRTFFDVAAPMFPDVIFHIFGVHPQPPHPVNVHYNAEIRYQDTWKFIRHATFGVAPYRATPEAEYIADTSSKLLQYGAAGLPSVCPHFAVGGHPNRFGYTPGDPDSIKAVIQAALTTSVRTPQPYRNWAEIAPRLIEPRLYIDTLLGSEPAPKQTPQLSLVVATRGRTAPLVRLLSSLREQQRAMFEVILVDQNEPGVLDDIVHRFAKHLEITHLRSSPGLSYARNVGLAACRGDIVGFPDDDCWYPPGRVNDILRFFDAFQATDILLGQTVDDSGKPSVNPVRGAPDKITPLNVWFSGNSNTLFIRKSVVQRLRFDEHLGVGAASPFQSGEETDLILNALNQGSAGTYCPRLTVYHDQVDNRIGLPQLRRAWRYSAGFGFVLRRHYSASYPAYRLARSLIATCKATLEGKPLTAAYRLIWTAGTLRGYIQAALSANRTINNV